MKTKIVVLLLLSLSVFLFACGDKEEEYEDPQEDKKPVIYLYPTQPTDVTVELDYQGRLTTTYPSYQGKWEVKAYPDGRLINKKDGREYGYLFWEGTSHVAYDFSEGFVVKGEDTAVFLQEKLAEMGLLPKEYNDFIVYWLPKMEDNPYNLIAFQGQVYTENAPLIIEPQPDSMLRVFMAYKPLENEIDISPQKIQPFQREGFTVIEWGGAQVE